MKNINLLRSIFNTSQRNLESIMKRRKTSITSMTTSTSSSCLSTQSIPTRSRDIKIVEVGPRDGIQNIPSFIATDDKIKLISKLSDAGCSFIEATSFVSPKWIPQMSDARDVLRRIKDDGVAYDNRKSNSTTTTSTTSSSTYSVLVPNKKGFESAMEHGADEISIFVAASEAFSKKNTNRSIEESFDRLEEVCDAARSSNVPLRGYVSCVLGCPYQGAVGLDIVARASRRLVEMGCKEVSLGDTIGVGTPGAVVKMIDEVKMVVDVDMIAVHFHDTYGQALANIYAALQEGVSTVDSSVAGLGGCPYAPGASGNVATEDVLYMVHGMGLETGIDLEKMVQAGDFICNVIGQKTNSRVATAMMAKSNCQK